MFVASIAGIGEFLLGSLAAAIMGAFAFSTAVQVMFTADGEG